MTTKPLAPLTPAGLYHRCEPDQFPFETTAKLLRSTPIIGQERAVEPVRFGMGMRQKGYNLFALGPHGVGKFTAVRHYLYEQAQNEPTPPDWCYVHHFEQEHRPRAFYSRETATALFPRLIVDYTGFDDSEPPIVTVDPLPHMCAVTSLSPGAAAIRVVPVLIITMWKYALERANGCPGFLTSPLPKRNTPTAKMEPCINSVPEG